MEYSVGSLADLISGTNTPNKPKVVKKKIEKPKIVETPIETKSTTPDVKKKKKEKQNKSHIGVINPEKKIKHKKRKILDQLEKTSDENDEKSPPKKRKLASNAINAEKRIEHKEHKGEKKPEEAEELRERTVFVGNIPINVDKKKIVKHFKKYGEIDSARIRGISVANPKTSKKVAAIKKEFHPDRQTANCYIRFKNKEDAQKALESNGTLFRGFHLRVSLCSSKEKPDESKALFVGNLAFDTEEEDLWKLFETCGAISHVRIIRDSSTGMGKGFGYVNFKESDAVQLALEMENVQLKNRELRISLCNLNMARKNKKKNKKKQISQPGKPKTTFKKNKNDKDDTETKPKAQNNADFQGTKFNDKKKKKKISKGLLEKKKLVKKLTAPKTKN